MKKIFLSLVMIAGLSGSLVFAMPASAAPDTSTEKNIQELCKANPNSSVCADLKDPNADTALNNTFRNIINVLIFVAGIIAVIMITISGIRFVTGRGSPDAVTKARNMLIYSIVGLVIAVSAFAIVNFVLSRL
ncbi:pilin [Candidatus Saccharibacteria bacterium]|nr:pilin [Candidatus Saccharibacteria bacterium]